MKITLIGAMGLMFVSLKLTGQITWPWTWVTCPFWIPIAVISIIGLGFIVAYSVIEIVDYIKRRL